MLRMARSGDTLAVHGATWDLNPKELPEHHAERYRKDPIGARRDLEADPPDSVQVALQDRDAVERGHDPAWRHPITEDGGFCDWFQPDPMAEYYVHGDLSKKRDSTGLAMVHYDVLLGKYIVDMQWELRPDPKWALTFQRILHIVGALKNRGFRIAKVTFDGWQSGSTIETLTNWRIKSEECSADRTTGPYDTLISLINEGKVVYGFNETFFREMRNLKLLDGKKYDHPEVCDHEKDVGVRGSKDLSDATACAVYSCQQARIGLTVGDTDLEKIQHKDHVLSIWNERTESGAVVHRIERLRVPEDEQRRARTVRIDLAHRDVVVIVGWYWKQEDRYFVDEVLLWESFDMTAVERFDEHINDLCGLLNVRSFSLGTGAPIECVAAVQRTGRPCSTTLNSRVPGQHRNVATAQLTLDARAVRLCLDTLRRGQISLPAGCISLLKDIRYATDDTLEQRPYLCSLAGWFDFATREMLYGQSGKQLPKSLGGGMAAAVTSSRVPLAATSSDPLDQIRGTQYDTSQVRSGTVVTPGSERPRRNFPRTRRV